MLVTLYFHWLNTNVPVNLLFCFVCRLLRNFSRTKQKQ